MHEGRKTLTRYTIDEEHRHPKATGDFSGLLNAIATAIKVIANQVNKGALVGTPVTADTGKALSEARNRLIVISNDAMIRETEWGGHLAAIMSAQMEQFYPIPDEYPRGKYLLVFDPLDGGINIDINLPVGTLFSVLRAADPARPARREDLLQCGSRQVAAGFALYGPSTILVLTTGHGVDGFTLDRDIGAFVLTHPQMRIPEDTVLFAINASSSRFWEPPIKRYVEECLAGKTGPREKDFNMRWIASLVAETFRILTRGGVFMYPNEDREGARISRLPLLYNVNPIAFLAEQAGGAASTGECRILDIQPEDLHQRVPFVFGSKNEVERIERYHREHACGLDREFTSPLFNVRSLFSTQ